MLIKQSLSAIAFSMSYLLLPSNGFADPIIGIQPAATVIGVGSSFDVVIATSTVADLYSYQFDLHFDPSIVHANSVTEGSYLSNYGLTTFISGIIDNEIGNITFTAASLVGPISSGIGSGILAIYSFVAIGIGVSPLTISNALLLDSALVDIPSTTSDGLVTAATIPEPTSFALVVLGLILAKKLNHGRQVIHS